jgi:hypothetical protein
MNKEQNLNKPKEQQLNIAGASGSFLEYTLENCHKAKKLLIETASFTEENFVNATQCDVECGYILGEPLILNGDDCTSALKLWNEKVFWDTHEDSYVDFMLNCH